MTISLPLIRNSERSDFKSCPKKWQWRWVDGLIPAMPKQDARWFGTMWHLLWATVYTPPGKDGFERGVSSHDEIHALWDELTKNAYTSVSGQPYFGDDDEMEFNDACVLGHLMIDGQLKEWNLDPGFEVLMPEQRFRLGIPYNERQRQQHIFDQDHYDNVPELSKNIGILLGTYDMPIRDHTDPGTPKCKILDWKTTNKRTNDKQLNKDDQTGTYLMTGTIALKSMGLIKKDESVEYMIFSFARKAKPPDENRAVDAEGRFRNKPQKNHYILAINNATKTNTVSEKDTINTMNRIATEMGLIVYGEISKNQGSPLFWRDVIRRNRANRQNQLSRIADEIEIMSLARDGDIPIIKAPGDHCNWCDFSDLCDIDEDGGDTETFIKDVFKYSDPYADHREGAVNSKESIKK